MNISNMLLWKPHLSKSHHMWAKSHLLHEWLKICKLWTSSLHAATQHSATLHQDNAEAPNQGNFNTAW